MIGTTLLERYHVEAQLGQGGMGIVYKAQDALLNRSVAIKFLNTSGVSGEARSRLIQEARAIAQLNHPNIVSVFDVGEAEGNPFIVMEFIQGHTLKDIATPSLFDALVMGAQICKALDHAHSKGIIHRDLKLENIIITESQTLKLMDFGLAHSADDVRLTEEGTIKGTLAYLAPELIQGQPPSVQSDLYAFGIIFYELLVGHAPFQGTLSTVLAQHMQGKPKTPSELNPQIPDWVDDLILQLLSKRPEERPASAKDVLLYLEQSSVAATPTGNYSISYKPNHNLPVQLTSFVGREKEIKEVEEALGNNRLVTLTGSGGTGKTRLALQIAANLLKQFPDGVWLVELAPLTDPDIIPQTILNTLGVLEQKGRTALQLIAEYVQDKNLLLVLDNCEHLIEASAKISETLLNSSPTLRILATSRETLGVKGEMVWHVPSLSLPNIKNLPGFDELSQYESIRLFTERAALARPQFTMTKENVVAIAQICQRLDGIPLALELAAARVNVLTVEQIAARLADTFRLLTGGNRTALPRQQTLQATVDWSYDLLIETERTLLRRLSVFASGWTLEAAEAACGGEGFESAEVLDGLVQLVNKSLVVAERQQGQETRYRMLETIRQYALTKLAASGEANAVRSRHAEYFLALAEAGMSYNNTTKEWLNKIEMEIDNLRSALAWSLSSQGSAELGLRLAAMVGHFCFTRGHLSEGRDWLKEALVHADLEHVDNATLRVHPLFTLGWLAALQGDYEVGQAYFADSLKLFQELGDVSSSAFTLSRMGWLARERGDTSTARLLLEESLGTFRKLGEKANIAEVLNPLGETLVMQEDILGATSILEESLILFRELGDANGIGWALNHLGHVAQLQGEYERAVRLHEESLPLFHESGPTWFGIPCAYQGLGETALAQGRATLAATHLVGSLKLFHDLGDRMGVSWCLAGLAGVAALNEESERAAWLWGAAEALRQSIGARSAPAARATHERLQAEVRKQLGDAVFNAKWAEGQSASMKQAIAQVTR